MPRTRSTKASVADSKPPSQLKPSVSRYQLDVRCDHPPMLFVLPKKTTKSARIVTLPHPRNSRPSRYLLCPTTGFYEFKKIAAPKSTPRSWLIHSTGDAREGISGGEEEAKDSGYITAKADLFIATAIDPLFIILPALVDKGTKKADGKKALFLTSEDYFDKLPQESSHLTEVLKSPTLQAIVESRMGAICDTVDAGDETMFRLNDQKLLSTLIEKARNISTDGLPPTMEGKFVQKPLEAPLAIQKRAERRVDDDQGESKGSTASTPLTESVDSTDTNLSSTLATSSTATCFLEDQTELKRTMKASADVTALQRLRVAFEYICSSYIAPSMANHLQQLLRQSEHAAVDFVPLDTYLEEITRARSEALAIRSIGDYSRKHGHDEEEDEIRAEKKRKMEEEKRKKATETRGVRDLKKVNTTGMKKLSAFFKKK